MEELNHKKMIVLIPFQVLRLRSLIEEMIPPESEHGKKISLDINRINRLQEEIKADIIGSIEMNLELGNITYDDSRQLLELTNKLYRHIRSDLEKKKTTGGLEENR